MPKIGLQNFRLPARKASALNSGLLLPLDMKENLQAIASARVMEIIRRAVDRAELYGSRHPFWNAIACSYTGILGRFEILRAAFPDIARVIHNDEVRKGDFLVSDFHTGLNFGHVSGGLEPVKICALHAGGGMLTGRLIRRENDGNETGTFRNELWFFVSHRMKVLPQLQQNH